MMLRSRPTKEELTRADQDDVMEDPAAAEWTHIRVPTRRIPSMAANERT